MADTASSSSLSPNFPCCSSPRLLALLCAYCLRSHFSVPQPEATSFHFVEPLAQKNFSPLSVFLPSVNFLNMSSTSLLRLTSAQTESSTPCAEAPLVLRREFFFLHIFNLFWPLHFFPFIWKSSSIVPIYKMGKITYSPACFPLIYLISSFSKLFESIILSSLLFFLKSNFIILPSGRFTPRLVYYRTSSLPFSAHF